MIEEAAFYLFLLLFKEIDKGMVNFDALEGQKSSCC